MDIAKAFEILSQGKIISSNSVQHNELSNMLLNNAFFEELDELITKIGYRLIGDGGCFYIAKKAKLNATEQQTFINRHRDTIVAISFLRQLYPRIDRGDVVSFVGTTTEYINNKQEDSSIYDRLVYFSWMKNKDDEKAMLEQLFKHLEDKGVIEKIKVDDTDKYKILDSINYYLSIVDIVEKGEE